MSSIPSLPGVSETFRVMGYQTPKIQFQQPVMPLIRERGDMCNPTSEAQSTRNSGISLGIRRIAGGTAESQDYGKRLNVPVSYEASKLWIAVSSE